MAGKFFWGFTFLSKITRNEKERKMIPPISLKKYKSFSRTNNISDECNKKSRFFQLVSLLKPEFEKVW